MLYGVRGLPERIGHRPLLPGLGALSFVVSLVLWVPALAEEVLGLEESVRWVFDLPTPVFVLVLAHALSTAADHADDGSARTWWRVVMAGSVVTIVLPPVVLGAGVVLAALLAVTLAIGTLLVCLVLCFTHSARPWVHDAPAAATPSVADPPSPPPRTWLGHRYQADHQPSGG